MNNNIDAVDTIDKIMVSSFATITFATIAFATILYYTFGKTVTNSLLYMPYKTTLDEFNKLSKQFKINEELVNFKTIDGLDLTGMLINYNKKADWNDIIFLYSHGNASWIGSFFNSHTISILSHFGSVFVYDYREYGLNQGNLSEEGTYMDALGAWDFLTKVKNVPPNKIIIYGHSMGGAVSTKLMSTLVENNQIKNNKILEPELPRGMILNGTFSNLADMGNHMLVGLGYLAYYKYDNVQNLKLIEKYLCKHNIEFPILIMHSKDDEIIPFEQSIKLKNACNSYHIKTTGTHNVPVFDKYVIDFIVFLTKKI